MKFFIPSSAMALLVLMVAWIAGSFDEKVAPDMHPFNVHEIDVDTLFKVNEVVYALLEPVPATITAKQTAVISSRILARIEEINVRAGDYVKKGQVLITLERTDLQSRVSQARSQEESVQARLNEAQQSLVRATELNNRGLLALADLEMAQANHKSLQAQQNSAQQALIEAETALNFARVLAPFDGLIVDRFAEPGSTAQPGVALLSLYNPSSMRVEANIRESLAIHLNLGQALKMNVPSTGMSFKVDIEERVPAGNSVSRTFMVKSQVNDTEGLLPGMYARLLVPDGTRKRVLVPENYIAEFGQLSIVWVVHPQGDMHTVEKRFVKVGLSQYEGMIEVISGLEQDEYLLPKPE